LWHLRECQYHNVNFVELFIIYSVNVQSVQVEMCWLPHYILVRVCDICMSTVVDFVYFTNSPVYAHICTYSNIICTCFCFIVHMYNLHWFFIQILHENYFCIIFVWDFMLYIFLQYKVFVLRTRYIGYIVIQRKYKLHISH
jgi:hypothetical protein